MKRTLLILYLTGSALLPQLMAADPAYFRIGDGKGDSVVVRITRPASIQQARDILAGRSPAAIMIGKVIPAPAFYNPGWRFHVDPVTVTFSDNAAEVCDAAIDAVDRGLNEVGASLLPSFRWCSWTTKVLAELPPPADTAQHAVHLSAADYSEQALAPGSIASAFGPGIVPNVSIVLTDSTGRQWTPTVLYSTPGQVNYLLPAGLAPGTVTAAITSGNGQRFVDPLYVHAYGPSLFSVTPNGLAAAWVTRVKADGSVSIEPVFRLDSQTQGLIPVPIALGPATDQVYLSLLGTGIRNRPNLDLLKVILPGGQLPGLYAGPYPSIDGVDQINVLLPRDLARSGITPVWIATLPNPWTFESEAVQLVFQ